MGTRDERLALPDWWGARVDQYGDRPAIEVGGVTRTYRELDVTSDRLAAGLASIGVGRGTRVAIMMPNRLEFIDAWFALFKLGAIEIPINTAYKSDLLKYLIIKGGAVAVVCDAEFVDVLREALAGAADGPRLIAVGGAASENDDHARSGRSLRLEDLYLDRTPPRAAVAPEDPCVVLYTSGTTGPSKGVVHTHRSCLRLSKYLAEVMEYGPRDVLYNFFPLFHQNARYTGVLPAFDVGARTVLGTRFSASHFWDECREKGITAFNYLGAVLRMLSNQPESARDREHSVTRAFGAGAPPEIWRRFEERFGVRLTEVYGLTEAPMATVNDRRGQLIGSAGHASDLFDVTVMTEDGVPAEPNEIGEIVVRPNLPSAMMSGYDGYPDVTLHAFRDLWFHTGDRGRMSKDGYLYFVDRLKDCIRRRGENISSWEVERVITEHPAVLEAAAYGVPSTLSEEEVMVAVVPRSIDEVDAAAIHEFSASRLPAYAVPRFIRFVASLPRTPTERVEKYRLRAEGVTADTWSSAAGASEPALQPISTTGGAT